MKLLYVFPEPLPLDRARGIQTAYTVRAIARCGIDVVLAHVPAPGDPFGACALSPPANVELRPLSYRLAWPLTGIRSTRIFSSRLIRGIAWNEIGAVFTRHLKVARTLLERFPHLPLVYEAHEVFTDTAPRPRRAQIEALERFVVTRAAALIANSRATARRLAERHSVGKDIEVIPNGVEYPQTVPHRDWPRARERVVYAGSFFGWKGVDDLVAAARTLEGFHIRMIGGDDASISRLRAAPPRGATLEFTGRVPHATVARELEQACIAVLPNRADTDSTFTSPIKLFEYMAAGCAIVAADIPAIREVLGTDDAAWVTPGDPDSLAQGIRALADAPARAQAMGAALRDKAKRYTWDARGDALARVLRPLMAAR